MDADKKSGELTVKNLNRGTVILLFLTLTITMLFSGVLAANQSRSVLVANNQQPTCGNCQPGVAKIAVNPSNITQQSGFRGGVTFEVNITDGPSITGYVVQVSYNGSILKGQSVDDSNNVLHQAAGSSGQVSTVKYCVDGQAKISGGCGQNGDGPGRITYDQVLYSSATTAPTSGKLFNMTLNAINDGSSQISFTYVALTNGTNIDTLPYKSYDGFYTDKSCGGQPCKAPTVSFTVAPSVPRQDAIITFNATGTHSNNPRGQIAFYSWDWGGDFLGQTVVANTSRTSGVINQTYSHASTYYVTLTATDNYGISGSYTYRLTVFRFFLDLGVADLSASSYQGVLPGAKITIVAAVQNYGSKPQNITAHLSLEGKILNTTSYLSVRGQNQITIEAVWDTTGYGVRVYRIDATVDELTNSTTGQPDESDCCPDKNNMLSTYIQLIELRQAGLISLGLLQTGGIGFLVIIAIGIVRVLFKKKPKEEPLPPDVSTGTLPAR